MSSLLFKTVFIILTADALVSSVNSFCLTLTKEVYFGPKSGFDIDCNIVPGAEKHPIAGYCVFQTCADLKDHSKHYLCCAEEGCIGDCIKFDKDLLLPDQTEPSYEEAFEKKYGHLVRVLTKAEANNAAAWGGAVHRG